MSFAQKRVLFVSKPVEAPWNDSSKNLVRDVHGHLERFRGTTMVRKGRVGGASVYANTTEFAPALRDNARVLRYLLADRSHDLWHFFFAPNPKTGLAGHVAKTLRRVPCVHTLCSAPKDFSTWRRSLFADQVVILSETTERRLVAAGFPANRLARIPPALPALAELSPRERQSEKERLEVDVTKPMVVYAGDLEFGGGAPLALEACRDLNVTLVMACRTKTPAAKAVEAELRARGGAHWVGETSRIHALLGAADVVLLPGTSLYAKMDYPLVVLEAMSMGRPVIVGARTPAEELSRGGAIACEATPKAVRASIEEALGNEGALGAQGAAYVREHFAPRRIAKRYEALYDRLVSSRR